MNKYESTAFFLGVVAGYWLGAYVGSLTSWWEGGLIGTATTVVAALVWFGSDMLAGRMTK